MLRRLFTLAALISIMALLLAACGGETPTNTAVPAPPTDTTAPVAAATDTTAPVAAATDTTAPVAAATDTTAPVAAATDTTAPVAAPTDTAAASTGGGSLQVIWFAWAPCQALTDLSK